MHKLYLLCRCNHLHRAQSSKSYLFHVKCIWKRLDTKSTQLQLLNLSLCC